MFLHFIYTQNYPRSLLVCVDLQCVTETQNTVKLTDRMWARLLASTNQPSFVQKCELVQERVNKQTIDQINNMRITSI